MDSCVVRVPRTLSLQSASRLEQDVSDACANPDVRVIVLEGEADVFCLGMDLEGVSSAGQGGGASSSEQTEDGLAAFVACLCRIARAEKPIIAVVRGEALGGGVGIAAASDLVIAADTASFALPEVMLGVVPGAIWPFVLGRMPAQKARLWALSGERFDAKKAFERGLVDRLAGPDLDADVRRTARFLRRVPPKALSALKELTEPDLESAVRRGAETTAALLAGGAGEAIARFLTHGEAPWERA